MAKTIRIGVATFAGLVAAGAALADTQLLMAEADGCIYCARWNADIGDVYSITGEGIAAPLRRIDMSEPLPDDITLMRPMNFTPTFVLLIDGTEVARIEGYPGEDFFWGFLGQMLEQHEIPFVVKQALGPPKP